MIARKWQSLLLSPEDVPPSRADFEVVGVFNPGAAILADEVVLLVRVAERPRERRAGFTALPRWEPGQGSVIDWTPDAELEPLDPRVVARRSDGLVRLTFLSHLRVVRCGDGRSVRVDRRSLLAELADGRIRRRRPQDHLDRRSFLDHLRRRLSPRRGDCACIHNRFSNVPTSWHYLLRREQGCRAFPGAD